MKVFLSDYNNHPKLVYVNVHLSSIEDTNKDNFVKITALHDSGCAKTVIKQSVFRKLLKKNVISIIQPEIPIVLVTCTQQQQPIVGTADIMLHFEGDNNIKMSFQLNVIIHDEISQDFLLGRDFTGSDAKAFETNSHLYLTNRFDVYWDEKRTRKLNDTLCHVPLINDTAAPMHVHTNTVTIIPAFSRVNVTCTLPQNQKYKSALPLPVKGQIAYEITNTLVTSNFLI